MCPSGQTYSIVEPMVLLFPIMVVFSDFSGLPQVGGPRKVKEHVRKVTLAFVHHELQVDKYLLTALTYPVQIIKVTADIVP